MDPVFFENAQDFRDWLLKNHLSARELLVGFYKTKTGKPSLTWPQSVDEALCFGWVDGVRKGIDNDSYSIRFTPRKPNSIWSAINIKKVHELTEKGLMYPAGTAAFENLKKEKTKIYSHENGTKRLEGELLAKFKANKKAWKYFSTQAPSYQKVMVHWILGAKQDATRQSRLEKTIAISEKGERMR